MLIGITILKVMGLKPLPETPLKGPYLKHDAVRLAEYFDVPFRYHGLSGINSLAALRAFVVLKERDAGLAKSLAQKNFRAPLGARSRYHQSRRHRRGGEGPRY